MTRKIKFKKTNHDIEKQILTGMIVSDSFMEGIIPIYKNELIAIPFVKKVGGWCISYWQQYQKAPNQNIEDIFKSKSRKDLQEEEVELISDFLSELSEEYERAEKFNTPYLLDKAEERFKARSLEILGEDITALLSRGDIKDAEQLVTTYDQIQRPTSKGINPFTDKEAIRCSLENREEDILFKMPSALGKFIGALERDMFISILAPEKRGKCITGDAMILLSDGRLKAMKEIIADKDTNIVSLDEKTKQFTKGKVIKHISNGKKKCFKVVTRTGREIKGTANHPLLTPTGWKNIEDIKKGEYVASAKQISFFGKKRLPEHKLKLMAYLIGDGCLRIENAVGFTNGEKALQDDFIKQIRTMGDSVTKRGIAFRITNHISVKGQHNKNNTKQFMKECGLLNKLSKEKEIPEIVFQLVKKDIARFLRTLFTCDGSVYKGGIEYSSASKKLALQIIHLLLRFGIVATMKEKHTKCNGKSFISWSLLIRDSLTITKFINTIGFDFKKGKRASIYTKQNISKKSFIDIYPYPINLQVRNEVLDFCKTKGIPINKCIGASLYETLAGAVRDKKNSMRTVMDKIYNEVNTKRLRSLIYPDIFWDKVTSISNIGLKETYDIAAETNHNFVANDIVVHNSFWLMEFAKVAYRSMCNVAFFGVGDMSEKQMVRRFHSGLLKASLKKQNDTILIPTLDCAFNQDDSCEKKERKCDFGVMEQRADEVRKMAYKDAPDYIPCIYCKKENPKEYKGASWYKLQEIKKLEWREAYQAGKKFAKRSGGKGFKLIIHPAHTLNVMDIKNQLNVWEAQEGFIPDIIIIDYADILAPEQSGGELRHQINQTWMALRALSMERHCLVLSATQADANSYNQRSISAKNFSEDKRKYGHVNMILTLNQTEQEKREGIMRIGKMFVREDNFDNQRFCTILESREIGRPYLNSY